MAGKERSHTERLEKILDFLGDHIRSAPGDELMQAARDEGRDPGEENTRLKGLLLEKLKAHQQKKLKEARAGFERELASISEGNFNLPSTPAERKALFIATLARASQLQTPFTMQHRDLSDFSDEDIVANLKNFFPVRASPERASSGAEVIPAGTPPEEILSTLGITEPDDIEHRSHRLGVRRNDSL
jgi:hypothetical protein